MNLVLVMLLYLFLLPHYVWCRWTYHKVLSCNTWRMRRIHMNSLHGVDKTNIRWLHFPAEKTKEMSTQWNLLTYIQNAHISCSCFRSLKTALKRFSQATPLKVSREVEKRRYPNRDVPGGVVSTKLENFPDGSGLKIVLRRFKIKSANTLLQTKETQFLVNWS